MRTSAADAFGIDRRKRILVENLLVLIHAQELADVVAREAERHLREVVGAEREELRFGAI
jgi:hypothetical protein